MNNIGLYIHVPFCLSKCPYCDFYSVKPEREATDGYKKAVIRNLKRYTQAFSDICFDTVYFGGGTPILLHEEICEILDIAGSHIAENAEITIEANPCITDADKLCSLKRFGVNRVSFGLQSANDNELKTLGRLHNAADGEWAVYLAHKAGIDNISADIMTGIPCQTEKSLEKTLKAITSLPVSHISAYMLKIEPNTPFYNQKLVLPDENGYAELYLKTVNMLAENGFEQYEISNFAKENRLCRHNLKYWSCEAYIGIGPAAHSYFGGRRYYVTRDLTSFIKDEIQNEAISDDNVGGFDEWAMLKLRLTSGIDYKTAYEKYGIDRHTFEKKCRLIPKNMYISDENGIRLTPEGFLVSNTVIGILTDI